MTGYVHLVAVVRQQVLEVFRVITYFVLGIELHLAHRPVPDAGQIPQRNALRTTSSRPLSGPHDLAFIAVAGYNLGGRGLIEYRQSLTSRGEPSVSSNHFVKSMVMTSRSTRTSATDTLTALSPGAIPAAYSSSREPPLHKMQRQ
jgi:hypothetical protein